MEITIKMKKLISISFIIVLLFSSINFGQFYPYNPFLNQKMQTSVAGTSMDRAFISHFEVSATNAVAASTTGIHAAVTDTGAAQTVSTSITDPAVPRNITATAGGTAGDIKAIQVIIYGTDYSGSSISETLTAFTENTAGTVQGAKAFATVDSVTIPAHDGTGATTAIGWGDKLGLPYKLSHNTVFKTYLGNTLEGTVPTVTVSATVLPNNTVDLNSALDGSKVDVYLIQ